MMEIEQVTKSNQVIDPIRVVFSGVTDEDDRQIRTAAYAAAGETSDSCFGAMVTRLQGGRALVKIYRD